MIIPTGISFEMVNKENKMDKFVRDKLHHNNKSIDKRIQSYIEAGKKFNRVITWNKAKAMYRDSERQEIWVNSIYQVNILRGENCDHLVLADGLKGLCDYLTIKRIDKKAIHDWRHFQIIKNELCGKEREAIEIYPAESRLVDTANQYHLWVIPKGDSMPYGWTARTVDYTPQKGGFGKVGQRGLDE